jgi:hypothetical protein
MRFFIGGRTSPGGLPDKSRKPYWNPVRKAGHVRCPKPFIVDKRRWIIDEESFIVGYHSM